MSKAHGLAASLASVRDAADRLNKMTDRAAETVRRVEEFLGERCSVGVTASVLVSEEDAQDFPTTWTTNLAYAWTNNGLRIVVSVYSEHDGRTDVKTWAECSRDVKLATVKKLPDLLTAIADEINKRISDAEDAIGTIDEVFNALKTGQ